MQSKDIGYVPLVDRLRLIAGLLVFTVLALALAFGRLSCQVIARPSLQMRSGHLRSPSTHAGG